MSHEKIAIFGAGGFGREVAWLVELLNGGHATCETVCFIEDNEELHGQVINDIPVYGPQAAFTRFPEAKVVAGIGSPRARETAMAKAERIGFTFATLIAPGVLHSKWIEIGQGTVICAGNILTTNIRLGDHVQINLDCTVGHDVVMEDFVTLAPGVHISGWVHLSKGVYIGTGAVVVNGTGKEPLRIGEDTVVGAGACVTKSLPSGVTAVGVPARPLQK